ncbi:MAG: ester cyclase [Coxiellaceae bacterium]|nr:ester cyclase [Coxiellaceae bacterium]
MTVEKNKILIQRYFEEAWNQGKLEVLDEIIDQNYINHSPGSPNPEPGPKGLKPIISAIRKGFPDLHFEIKNMVVTDDQVAIHSVMHGTHTGELFGMAPTGKKVAVNQMQIERIKNEKIVEHWRQSDDMGMMRQLGQIK